MADKSRKKPDKIFEIIKEIEDLVEKSKTSPLSQSKIVVNKEEIQSLLRELRMKAPDEIERYRKMLDNRDAIMADAENKAEKMIEEARMNIQNLVDEHEIVQQALAEADKIMADANHQAEELLYNAQKEADMMHRGAVRYMAENLNRLQSLIDGTMNNFDNRFRGMMNTMEKYSALVKENKDELLGRTEVREELQPEPVNQESEAPLEEASDIQISDNDFE